MYVFFTCLFYCKMTRELSSFLKFEVLRKQGAFILKAWELFFSSCSLTAVARPRWVRAVGGGEAAPRLVHLLRQTGSVGALRSAPPANRARPEACALTRTAWRPELTSTCGGTCCFPLQVPRAERPKVSPRTFNAE